MNTQDTMITQDLAPKSGRAHDPQVIIAWVNELSHAELLPYSAYLPIDLRHYATHQQKWLQDSIYYLGIDLCHRPDPGEIANKILNSDDSNRFRAYYALRFPDRVSIDESTLQHIHTILLRMQIDQ